MAKKCIVNRSPDGQIRFVGTPNPNQTDAVKLAISRNKGNPLSQTSKGEPSLLYNSYIELLGLSPEAAEKAVAEQFSDKFGRWFGRWWEPGNTNVSKVVDENGQPRIVWSGQKGQYFTGEYKGYSDTFEKDGMMRFDRTALFTYSKYDALSYATGWDMPDAKTFERVGKHITEPYHLEPVFLNIRNIQSVEKLNYDKVIPRFPEFESKKIDGLTGLSDSANGTVRELLSIRDSHQMRLIRPEINFQNETSNSSENIPQEILREVTDVLLQKGLVSQVNLMTPQELRTVLEEMGLSEETMKQIEAWHGSPHLFDKFSTSAIGTGEGAQAFGWGLYFTDLKGIAENYATKLTRRDEKIVGVPLEIVDRLYKYGVTSVKRNTNNKIASQEIDSRIYELNRYKRDYNEQAYIDEKEYWDESKEWYLNRNSTDNDLNRIDLEISNLYSQDMTKEDLEKIYSLENERIDTEISILQDIKEEINNIGYEKNDRKLYNVSLHQGKTPEQYNWLEWDKPINDSVLKVFQKFNKDQKIELGDDHDEAPREDRITGERMYEWMTNRMADKDASLFLLENGIDGIKYPAESLSRGATSDDARGFNYVVFDENAVTINEVVQFQNSVSIKPGVSEIFQENPELSPIGTEEEYSEYLDTIFPNNKLKDIVYHGTTKGKFDKFITEGSSDNIGKLGAMAGSIEAANLQRGKQDRPDWVRPEEWVEPELPKGSHLYSLLFNLKNPYIADSLDAAMILRRNDLKEKGYDGVIIRGFENDKGRLIETGFGDEYVAFEPEQIHILGSKQDIEGFKDWKSNKSKLQNDLEKAGIKLVPNGFYRPSTREIYLNSENPRILETTIHEFAHPFLQYLRDNKPAHYRAGVKLLETNSNEAQKYIDLVLRTQPSLKQGSQAFNEEVLAQIVGDNGAKLVNSAKANSIKEWLQNLWETIGKMLGITQRTPEEISKMTLREFSDAVTAEMLDLQAVKNSSLTLSVLEQPHFTQMRGRSISPQTISNAVKGKGVKEIERQIITSVLAIPEFQTKKINYNDFELAVKAQLMPLEKIVSESYADYGSSGIDGKYDSTTTLIYNSPLDHGIKGHFTEDYENFLLERPVYFTRENVEFIDEDTAERIIVIPGEEPIPLDSITEQEIQEKIDIYNKDVEETYALNLYNSERKGTHLKNANIGLFGHTRVWTKDDIYNVAEVQSDFFQKNNLHRITEFGYEELDKLRAVDEKAINRKYNEIFSKFLSPVKLPYSEDAFDEIALNMAIDEKTDLHEEEILENRQTIARLRDKQAEVRNNREYDELESEIDRLKEMNSSFRFQEKSNLVFQRLMEIHDLHDKEYEKTLNENEKQFLASEKSFELRLIRESIQDAADQGFKKLRLPLPYTLSKIEGYLSEGGQVEIEGEPGIGDYVDYLGGEYRVVDYEGDDVKIISKGQLNDSDKDQYIEDWAYNEIEGILYDHFQDENVYSLEEIKSKLDQTELKDKTKFDIVQMLKEESEQTDEIDITDYREQMEEIFVENVSNTDLEYYLSDLNYSTVVLTKDRILYSTEEGEWVSYSNGSQDKESFSIDDLSEYHQPVARRYEYFGKLLEKERPGNVKVIDDENGYPWYETQILESDKNSPVLAFQAERSDQDRLIRTGLELGHEYDTDKVARERFDIPNLKRISSGSDRVVYEIDQNYVLKVAKTARGLEQNLHEGNDMLVKEGLIPDVIEAGLNYVVVEKVTPIKAKDLVPIYNTEGEQTGTERADRMFAELSRFHQADFELRNQKFLDILYKYGMYDVTNHELLVGDFSRKSNWGIRDGMPIHIDAGTFAGESLLTDYAGKRNLDDPDFREIYERSRQAKKLYGDRDTNTMFQMSEVTQNQMIPSQLYEQLRQQPFVDSEQALEAYKNVYTDSVGDWQSTEFNC